MKYVIDASTAFQWEVPEPDSLKAIQLREAIVLTDELVSPDIFPVEVGYALSPVGVDVEDFGGQCVSLRLFSSVPTFTTHDLSFSVRVISSPPSRQVSDSAFTMPSTWPWPSVRVAISFLAMAS